ncbi:MAG: hypothetical protein P8J78_00895 [Maricaulis sp.]|nr:hypothetical protein [Maricaulis sp.]MDG2043137.1 hypothetical protein [Maricaulis sp.]
MRHLIPSAALIAAFAVAPALADEVWTSDAGQVIYEADIGEYAVLTMRTPKNGSYRVYIRGLAGNYDNRVGQFTGYWIATDPNIPSPECDVTILTVDDRTTHLWGRVNMTFDRPAYPTGFSAQIGDCYEEPNVQWTGRE